MFNETSYNGLRNMRGFLGPPIRTPKCGPRDLGCANPSPLVKYAYDPLPPNGGHPYGDDQITPADGGPVTMPGIIGIPPVEGSNVGTGLDFGALLGGTTLGLPNWALVAGAAWFFFFRKGR